jgi:hypothetical protein
MKRLLILGSFLLWGAAVFGTPTLADLVQRFHLLSSPLATVRPGINQLLQMSVQRLGVARDRADAAIAQVNAFDFDSHLAQLLQDNNDRLSAEERDGLAALGDTATLNRIQAADDQAMVPGFLEQVRNYHPDDLDADKKSALAEAVAFETNRRSGYLSSVLKVFDGLLRPLVPEANLPDLDALLSTTKQAAAASESGYARGVAERYQYLYRDLPASDIEALNALHQDPTYLKLKGITDDVAEALLLQLVAAVNPPDQGAK